MCDQGLGCASQLQLLTLSPLCPSQNRFLLKYTERWSASRSGCSDLARSPEMVEGGGGAQSPQDLLGSHVTACLRLPFPLLLLYSFFL